MDFSGQLVVGLLGDLGALGFVLWTAWRLTSHTIPRLATQFETATDRQRVDFREALQQQRVAFGAMMEREREVHGQHITRIVESIKDLKP